MKKSILTLLFSLIVPSIFAVDLATIRGVWANNMSEAVVTDSICIFFEKKDSIMQAIIEVPSIGVVHKTLFSPGGNVSFSNETKPLSVSKSGDNLVMEGQLLSKVESFETTGPYEMFHCDSPLDVGKCLQEWRLGVKYGQGDDMIYCEINTNRHMFIYMINQSMVYIRAAATRNNNHGTLFFQNIRMMKNHNTGEYTIYISPDNLAVSRDDLEIDNSNFQPNSCTFSPDGGIYWSLISFSADQILLNGCGETYQVNRPAKDFHLDEWIKFEEY